MNYYVYIVTSNNSRVLYTGVTNDIKKRVYQHKAKLKKAFLRNIMLTGWCFVNHFQISTRQSGEKNKSRILAETKRKL